jgi:hypothetical protein
VLARYHGLPQFLLKQDKTINIHELNHSPQIKSSILGNILIVQHQHQNFPFLFGSWVGAGQENLSGEGVKRLVDKIKWNVDNFNVNNAYNDHQLVWIRVITWKVNIFYCFGDTLGEAWVD